MRIGQLNLNHTPLHLHLRTLLTIPVLLAVLLVLTEPGLTNIVALVEQGRTIYQCRFSMCRSRVPGNPSASF